MPSAGLVRSSKAVWDFSINFMRGLWPRVPILFSSFVRWLCSVPGFDVEEKPCPMFLLRESLKSKRIRVQNVLDSLDNASPA